MDEPDTLGANTSWPALDRALEAIYQYKLGNGCDVAACVADFQSVGGKAGRLIDGLPAGVDLLDWSTGYMQLDRMIDAVEMLAAGEGSQDVGTYLMGALEQFEKDVREFSELTFFDPSSTLTP